MGSSWVDIGLAVACLAAAVGYLVVARRRPAEYLPHAAMGVGMAAMFVPAADPLPRPVWLVIFAGLAVWSGVAAARARSVTGEAGHHLVCGLAMVVMFLVHGHRPADGAGMTEHHGAAVAAGGAAALLTSLVALALAAWFVADILRTLAAPVPTAVGSAVAVVPRTGTVEQRLKLARVVMGGAMVAMLVVIA